jgi:hypothetical protein
LGNTEPAEPDAEDSAPDAWQESSSKTRTPSQAENQALATTAPRVLVVNSTLPNPDQVNAAFLLGCKDSEDSLHGRDFFNLAQSLVVFDHFEVKKLRVKRNQGWAEVQIDELVSLTGSKAEVHRRSERQRWPLTRRDDKSWTLTPSQNTIYLSPPIAERILAHELAQLTDESSDAAGRTLDKAHLARLLNVLLDK